jgi:hypothetical protein
MGISNEMPFHFLRPQGARRIEAVPLQLILGVKLGSLDKVPSGTIGKVTIVKSVLFIGARCSPFRRRRDVAPQNLKRFDE